MRLLNKLRTFYLFSLAERASALEMLSAARTEHDPKLFAGFLHHAEDEYRHASIFRNLALNEEAELGPDIELKPRSQDVKQFGYVDSSRFLHQKLSRDRFGIFIAVHEHLAVREFEALCSRLDADVDRDVIRQIVADEQEHAVTILKDEERHARLAKRWTVNNVMRLKRSVWFVVYVVLAKYNKLRGHAQLWAAPIGRCFGVPLAVLTLLLFRCVAGHFPRASLSRLDRSLL